MIMPPILAIHQETENRDVISVVDTEIDSSRIIEAPERALESSILNEFEAVERGKEQEFNPATRLHQIRTKVSSVKPISISVDAGH
jgi:hypothetical protein